jgi:hypothetical protein
VRFLAASGRKTATAATASGYLFNVRRHAETGKWYAEINLRGVRMKTRQHKHAWQAAAELEWQLARWCAHTGQPRSRYVSNAARLVELGHADAAGVLTEAATVTPWDLSGRDGGGEPQSKLWLVRVAQPDQPPPPAARTRSARYRDAAQGAVGRRQESRRFAPKTASDRECVCAGPVGARLAAAGREGSHPAVRHGAHDGLDRHRLGAG